MSLAQQRAAELLREHGWEARVLSGPPLIAPTRRIVLPQIVPGEEDAMARGALWITVRDSERGTLLVQCALGFAGSGVAHGMWALPEQDRLLAVAGGYAYEVHLDAPGQSSLLPPRPTVAVVPCGERTVLVTHHGLLVRERGGALWASPRLSWEGVDVDALQGDVLQGRGWDMIADREIPFTVDLRSHTVEGGGYRR